jgi:hypothetical protein
VCPEEPVQGLEAERTKRTKRSTKMKIVINKCYGGYGLSEKAYAALGLKWDDYGFAYEDDRANPKLVEVVEKLGDAASGYCSRLEIVEIPDDVVWEIDEYDGMEMIRETHRTWG